VLALRLKLGKWFKRRDIHQIVEAPVGRHSAKPDEVRQRIVDLCGDVPRVELFARENLMAGTFGETR